MKLGDLCDVVRGCSPRPQGDSRYFGGNIPRLMIADVTRDGRYVTPTIDSLTEEGAKKSRPMKKGDVVIAVSGDPGRPCILAVDACIHDGFVGLRNLDESKILKSYLFCYLNYFKLVNKRNAVGAIFQNLTTDQIKKIEIPEISIHEQISIVKVLNKAETLITQRKESILLLEELLKSTFLEMFGDPVRNEKGWEKGLFRSIAKIDRVHISPQEITHRDYYIGLEDITKNSGEINKTSTTNADELKSSKFKFTNKHVLYAKLRPNLNKVALPNEDGICSTDIFPILPIENISQKFFVCYLMRSNYFVQEMTAKSAGANLPRASAGAIESLEVYKPPISIQDKFAKLVEKAENLKVEYKKSLIELENLFGVLSQKAFKREIVESEENQLDKKKDDAVMEEEPDEIIDVKDYTQNKKEKVDITNMTFAEYVEFPEEFQIRDEKWMSMFLGQDEFYQF